MCFDKDSVKTSVVCPHLKCSNGVASCAVAMDHIRNIAGADIRFCTGRHYEACFVYFTAIRSSHTHFIVLPAQ